MICSQSICIFPLGCLVFTVPYCKAGHNTHPCRAFRMPLSHCLMHAGHALHCGTRATKKSHRLTWCSEGVKCLSDIWADAQILDTTCKNSEVYKKKKRVNKWKRRARNCLVRDHINHIDKWFFDTCCQSYQGSFFSGLLSWLCLQCKRPTSKFKWSQHHLGCLVPHQSVIVVFTYSTVQTF